MEAKAKGASKATPKAEKKEPAPPPKSDPITAEPAAPEPDKTAEDGSANQPEAAESSGSCCETLESLKPFLIGGAVVAIGAVLVGVILLVKKN